jgi:hypothetical protein
MPVSRKRCVTDFARATRWRSRERDTASGLIAYTRRPVTRKHATNRPRSLRSPPGRLSNRPEGGESLTAMVVAALIFRHRFGAKSIGSGIGALRDFFEESRRRFPVEARLLESRLHPYEELSMSKNAAGLWNAARAAPAGPRSTWSGRGGRTTWSSSMDEAGRSTRGARGTLTPVVRDPRTGRTTPRRPPGRVAGTARPSRPRPVDRVHAPPPQRAAAAEPAR